MLDILLWILAMIIVEGGAVALAWWLWKAIDEASTTAREDLFIVAFAITVILIIVLGIVLVASAVLGTIQLFGMYA